MPGVYREMICLDLMASMDISHGCRYGSSGLLSFPVCLVKHVLLLSMNVKIPAVSRKCYQFLLSVYISTLSSAH